MAVAAVVLGMMTTVATAGTAPSAAKPAPDVDYISPARVGELERLFASARAADLNTLSKSKWSCAMFGMRSKLYVERDLNLYAFRAGPVVDGVQTALNDGDEPITSYRVDASGFAGRGGSRDLLDQIRITSDGRLISKLTQSSQNTVIAYATCTGS